MNKVNVNVRIAMATVAGIGLIGTAPATLLAQARGDQSTCVVNVTHTLNASVVLRGEAVTATLMAKPLCAAEAKVAEVVIVLDGSDSMRGAPLERAIDAAEALVDWLDLEASFNILVGVVGFGNAGSYQCSLTSDRHLIQRCIGRARSVTGGGTVYDMGLGRARRAFERATPGHPRDTVERVVVVFSNGGSPTDCDAARDAAHDLRAAETKVVAACASADCDATCLRGVASSNRDFVAWTELPRTWLAGRARIGAAILRVQPRLINITGTLPVDTRLVPGSMVPSPRRVSPDGRTFEWIFLSDLAQGITVTLGIRPTVPGDQAPSLQAQALWQDNLFRDGAVDFSNPQLLVLAPVGR